MGVCLAPCRYTKDHGNENKLTSSFVLQKPELVQPNAGEEVVHSDTQKTQMTESTDSPCLITFLNRAKNVASPIELVNETAKRLGNFAYPPLPSGTVRLFIDEHKDGNQYIGLINSHTNEREGVGIVIYSDGSRFDGCWKGGLQNGKGRLIKSNGEIYDGSWVDGKPEGAGVYIYPNGSKYEGEWKNGLKEGQGTELASDGSLYTGTFHEGRKNGSGKLTVTHVMEYEGEFKQDAFCGTGKCGWEDGKRYEGQWQNGLMHGQGTLVWPDGRKYCGEHFAGKKQGHGVFEWKDGRKYDGEWLEGMQHGKGTFVTAQGKKREADWVRGKVAKWIGCSDSESTILTSSLQLNTPRKCTSSEFQASIKQVLK